MYSLYLLKFYKCSDDPFVYDKLDDTSKVVTVIALYFDDLVIACSNLDAIRWIKNLLIIRFEMMNLGKAKNVSRFANFLKTVRRGPSVNCRKSAPNKY